MFSTFAAVHCVLQAVFKELQAAGQQLGDDRAQLFVLRANFRAECEDGATEHLTVLLVGGELFLHDEIKITPDRFHARDAGAEKGHDLNDAFRAISSDSGNRQFRLLELKK